MKRVFRDNIIQTTVQYKGEESLSALDKLYLKNIRLTLAKKEALATAAIPFDLEIAENQKQIDLLEKLDAPSVLSENLRKVG